MSSPVTTHAATTDAADSESRAARIAPQLEAVASAVGAIAAGHARNGLAARLATAAGALSDTTVRVVVVGQFKQGKSALVNALVGAPVCPVDDLLATSVPTVVRWGDRLSAALITELADEERTLRAEVEPHLLRRHVTELAGDVGLLGSLRAEITVPSQMLAGGLVLVDTPGSGRAQTRAFTNLALLPQVDAAILVSDATQELTEPELVFAQQAAALCPRIAFVLSKTDLQHEWRGIVDADAVHLASADVHAPVIATSALLHDLADEESDPALRDESRIPVLARHLDVDVREQVLAERHRAVADDIRSVGEHLAMVLEAELRALDGTDDGADTVRSLERAEARAASLSQRTSRWQQTLSDGAGELISDVEFDLRDRLRSVGREAEQIIADSDPGKTWDATGTWLAESITQAVSDNFVWAHQRSAHLAEVVSEHFSLDGHAAVPHLAVAGAEQALGAISGLEQIGTGRLSIGQKLMIGLKGSYGGVLMFGLMTTLAGMALVNPISITAGLIMGGFAYRQETNQRLEQRRGEARNAVRKLIDESIFQISKESRDQLGRTKRVLRDHFVAVAEDLTQSLNESVRTAKRAAALPPSERATRVARIRAELAELRALCRRAEDLTHEPVPMQRAQRAL